MSEANNSLSFDQLATLYDDWMVSLRSAIDAYQSEQLDHRGNPRTGMVVFCEDVKINRSNLGKIFSPEHKQEMSLYVFYTITTALGFWPEDVAYSPSPSHHTMSLRNILSIPYHAILLAGTRSEKL